MFHFAVVIVTVVLAERSGERDVGGLNGEQERAGESEENGRMSYFW